MAQPTQLAQNRYLFTSAKNAAKTAALMAALIAFLAFVGNLLGGSRMMTALVIVGLLVNLGTYWFSDKLALAGTGAYPADPVRDRGLYQIVRRLAHQSGIPEPKLYIVPSPTPNAFATGRGPRSAVVAVNEGLLDILDEPELEGVIAHELSHVKNRDILIGTIAAAIAGIITWIANIAQFGLIFGGSEEEDRNPWAALLLIFLAPIAAVLIQLAISRAREYQADASGAEITGDPLALASALQKLEAGAHVIPEDVPPSKAHLYTVSPLAGEGLASLFSTHPPIEKRIERLRELAGR